MFSFFAGGRRTAPPQEEGCTERVWVYDLRTNMPSFGKRNLFGETHLKPFETVFGDQPDGAVAQKEGEWSWVNGDGEKTARKRSVAVLRPGLDREAEGGFAGYQLVEG